MNFEHNMVARNTTGRSEMHLLSRTKRCLSIILRNKIPWGKAEKKKRGSTEKALEDEIAINCFQPKPDIFTLTQLIISGFS